MRILVISDRYPPFFEGGYEIICREVNRALAARGHRIRVLTTTFGINRKTVENEVYRIFDCCCAERRNFLEYARKEVGNKCLLFRHIRTFRPDLISVWHPAFLSKVLLTAMNSLPIPMVLNFESHWPVWWYYEENIDEDWFSFFKGKTQDTRFKSLMRKGARGLFSRLVPVSRQPLRVSGAWFTSDCLKAQHREAGFSVSEYPVIYNGLDLGSYPLKPKKKNKKCFRLLWINRIADYKGPHIALEAIRILTQKMGVTNIKLSMIGDAGQFDKTYFESLKNYVIKEGISEYVSFEGKVPYEDLPRWYSESDLFLFTSIYKEPFGLCWLYAFAHGVPVVGTVAGGSREIFINDVNAITYEAEDPASLALGIRRLLDDDDLYYRIQKNAIDLVKREFSLETMADKIESLYQAALRKKEKNELSPLKVE